MRVIARTAVAFLLAGRISAATFPAAKSVDSLIDAAVADGKIPGAVLVVGHQGEVVYRKAYGLRAILPAPEPMTVDTIFDCASLTKVVATTSAIMKLFEAGIVHISDPVTAYLPEFQGGKSTITIRDLMTHFSGLRPDLDLDPAWSGYDEGIRRALTDVPAGPPGVKFVYSDINFILLGEIVRRVSGKPLDQFASEEIFQPLGMRDTLFRPPASLLPRIAPTEKLKTGEILRGVVHDPTSRNMGGVAGHAGLFSTADDLARFCQMLLDKGAIAGSNGRLFSPLTVEMFTSPQSPRGAEDVRGLGWDINSRFSGNRGELFPAGSSFGHTGFTGTSLWMDPKSDTYVILLTNAVHPAVGKPVTALRKGVATAVAAAVGYSRNAFQPVRTGLDVWEDEHFRALAGKRVGLITNQTGVDRNGRRNIDAMREAGVNLTALFSPEHGFLGREDRPDVASSVDKATGIRVFSLFSGKTQRPTPEMLRGVDVLVFDIADVGARFYTYTTTMAYAMEEAAKAHKPFVVLDRPNPITGLHVEGPVLDPENESFVGYFPMPIRHGMTLGELAKMFNAENKIGAELTVVPMTGWRRSAWFDSTRLPWIDPSPNIRSLTAALLYPAVAMLEYAENYSVGRGTPDPFEVIGADWMKGEVVAEYLNSREIPGVRAYPVRLQPTANHFSGKTIEGVRFEVIDRDLLNTAQLGLEIAAALRTLYPGKMDFDVSKRLIGGNGVIEGIKAGTQTQQLLAGQAGSLERFQATRNAYLLYQ